MTNQSPGGALLNENEASAFLNVSVRTLQTWRVKGGGPRYCKIGRNVRYRQSALNAWLDERTCAHTSEYAS